MTRILLAHAVFALLLAAPFPRAHAQDALCIESLPEGETDLIGCVNTLRERRWLFFNKTVDASTSAEIRRPQEGGTMRVLRPVEAPNPVRHRDIVRLNNRVDMELYLSSGTSRSRVVLERGGLWELQKDTVPRLIITHGQMIVDQIEGRLEASLENVLNVIHATTVYYDVDSTDGVSYVFLKEGHMSFPEYDIDVQGSDSLWLLRDGLRPEAVPATADVLRRWSRHEEHASREMWRAAERPIVHRPKFWLLTGGLVAGAALFDCVVTQAACNAGSRTGGQFRIPIPE